MEPMDDGTDALLDDAVADESGLLGRDGQKSSEHFARDPHANLPVYTTIHR